MSRTGHRFAIITGVAAGLFLAILALSPTAAAEPAAPTTPGVPGLVQQLAASPSNIPQALENAAAIFTGVPATPPVAPPPTASAELTLPQVAAPATPAPATSMVPSGQLNLPGLAGLPMTLPSQLGFPRDLAQLVPGGVPLPNVGTKPAGTPSVTAPNLLAPPAPTAGQPAPAPLNPVAGLP